MVETVSKPNMEGGNKSRRRRRTIKSSSSRAPSTTTASFYIKDDIRKLIKQCKVMRELLKPSKSNGDEVWDKFLFNLGMELKCIREKNDCNTYAVCPIDIYLKHMQKKKLRNTFVNDSNEKGIKWIPCTAKINRRGYPLYNLYILTNSKFDFTYQPISRIRQWMDDFKNGKDPKLTVEEKTMYALEPDSPGLPYPESGISISPTTEEDDARIPIVDDNPIHAMFISSADTFHDFSHKNDEIELCKDIYKQNFDFVLRNNVTFNRQKVQSVLQKEKFNGLSYERCVENTVEEKLSFMQGVTETINLKLTPSPAVSRIVSIVLGVPGDRGTGRQSTGIFTQTTTTQITNSFRKQIEILFGVDTKFVIDRTIFSKEYFGSHIINTCASVFDGSCKPEDKTPDAPLITLEGDGNLFVLPSLDVCESSKTIRPDKNLYKTYIEFLLTSNPKNRQLNDVVPSNEIKTAIVRLLASIQPQLSNVGQLTVVDVIKILHDLKRAGDLSQVHSVEVVRDILFSHNVVFVTHDIITCVKARMLGLNVILTRIESLTRNRVLDVYRTSSIVSRDSKKEEYTAAHAEIKRIFDIIQNVPDTTIEIDKVYYKRQIIDKYISFLYSQPLNLSHDLHRGIYQMYGCSLLAMYEKLVINLKIANKLRKVYSKAQRFASYPEEYTNTTNYNSVMRLYDKVKEFKDIQSSMVMSGDIFQTYVTFLDNVVSKLTMLEDALNVLMRQANPPLQYYNDPHIVDTFKLFLIEMSRLRFGTDEGMYIELLNEATYCSVDGNQQNADYVERWNAVIRKIYDSLESIVDNDLLTNNPNFTRLADTFHWRTRPAQRGGRKQSGSSPQVKEDTTVINTTAYSLYAIYLLNNASQDPSNENITKFYDTLYNFTRPTSINMKDTFPSIEYLRKANDKRYKVSSIRKAQSPKAQSAPAVLRQPKKSTLAVKEASLKKQSLKTLSPKAQSAPAVLQEQSMRTSMKKSPKVQSAPAALEQQQPHPSVSVSESVSANVSESANVRSSSKKSIRSSSAVNKSNNGSNANSASVDSLFGPGSESPTTTLLPLPTERTRNTKKKSK